MTNEPGNNDLVTFYFRAVRAVFLPLYFSDFRAVFLQLPNKMLIKNLCLIIYSGGQGRHWESAGFIRGLVSPLVKAINLNEKKM